jgi:large subunit ribosomal protein L4
MKEAKTTTTREIFLHDISGKEIDKIKLPKAVSDTVVNQELLQQAVLMYQTNLKTKLSSAKTRSEVSGGGIKPWRQKGTGRARAGSIRSPLWRKGGVVFGPIARNSHYNLSQTTKLQALKNAIIDKLNSEKLFVIDELKIEAPKTKLFAQILKALKVDEKTLFLLSTVDTNILRASRNLEHIELKSASDVNAFDILRFRRLIVTKLALTRLLERIK